MRHPLALLLALALGLGACAGRGKLIQRKAVPLDLKHLQAAATPVPAVTVEPSPTPQLLSATVQVKKGESLWVLARRHLGRGIRYPEIASPNAIDDPWIIHPGQTLQFLLSPPKATPTPRPTPRPKDEAVKLGWKRQANRAYTVGEKLTFAVQYGSVTAGFATLSIPEAVVVAGRPTFHIVAEAKTHPFFERIFKVRDRIESFIDVEYGFPWRYEKHLREGGYSADAFYLFDQRGGRIVEPDKGKSEPMPIGSQDVLSCFYWFRTLPLNVGDVATIPVTADNMKTYELKVNVIKKERVKTLAGDFDTVLVQPHLTFQGVFQQKGEVLMWITDDVRRIPVKVRSKIAIGSININLQNAEWVEPAVN